MREFDYRKLKDKTWSNEILIKVKSENEKTKTYTIIVNKKDDRENNNYLKFQLSFVIYLVYTYRYMQISLRYYDY